MALVSESSAEQEDGGLPTILSAGSAPGEGGVSDWDPATMCTHHSPGILISPIDGQRDDKSCALWPIRLPPKAARMPLYDPQA